MPRKKHRHRADGEHFSLDIPFNRTIVRLVVSDHDGRRHNSEMEPQERTVSPLHQRRRTTTSGPEEDHSLSRRSNGWAECREKNIGIGPMGSTLLLTFLLIGSLRTTSSLNIGYVLMIFSRSFRLHLCALVRRFSGSVRKLATRAAPCYGSHGKPTSAPHGIFVTDNPKPKSVRQVERNTCDAWPNDLANDRELVINLCIKNGESKVADQKRRHDFTSSLQGH